MTKRSLADRVAASLARTCGADAVRHVRCVVKDGHVSLTGEVATRDEVALCSAAARTVPGVVSFDNKLSALN